MAMMRSIGLIFLFAIAHGHLFSRGEAYKGKVARFSNTTTDYPGKHDISLNVSKPPGKGKQIALDNRKRQEEETGGIMWEHLSVATSDSGEYLLHPSSGLVSNGHVCGVLGPSGAGKSTLVSTIAGRGEASLRIDGHVLHLCSESYETFYCAPVMPDTVAWLQQHDAFFERLTVKETLDLAVFLELPQLTAAQRGQVADDCLESLGLSKLKSRQIGSSNSFSTSNGASLSGGELRRLSVALELVVSGWSNDTLKSKYKYKTHNIFSVSVCVPPEDKAQLTRSR
jgi:ABC-type uncharacterized transport system YnjBCD ATPase subunit